jgi:hypothetical protein
MRVMKYVGHMEEMREACEIVVGKPELKKPEALA